VFTNDEESDACLDQLRDRPAKRRQENRLDSRRQRTSSPRPVLADESSTLFQPEYSYNDHEEAFPIATHEDKGVQVELLSLGNAGTCCCAELKNKLELHHNQQRVIMQGIDKIYAAVRKDQDRRSGELPPEVELPCNNLEGLSELENHLVQNKNDRVTIGDYLRLFSEANLQASVRSMCRKVFAKTLAKSINMVGSEKKKGLEPNFPTVLKVIRSELLLIALT
jgi:hypothetical protein